MPKKTFPQESEFNRIHLESDKHVVVTHTATACHLKYIPRVDYSALGSLHKTNAFIK